MSQSSRRQTPFLVAGDAQEGGPALGTERHRKMGVRIFRRVAEGGSLSCTHFVLIINQCNHKQNYCDTQPLHLIFG